MRPCQTCSGTDISGNSITSSSGKIGIVSGSVGCAAARATYAGRPLYFYVGDRRPGQVLCQNVVEFGGRWLVLRASGQLVH